jgi:hypothetical protein
MMLVLAVRSDAERVYLAALGHFTPDDVAEAFAAARGLASPTQLRAALKKDGRDLLAQFRRLAPERRPIAIQRWSVRRVVLTAALLAGFGIAAYAGANQLVPVQDLPVYTAPECGTSAALLLAAQAVPTATKLPCIAAFPSGWSFGLARIHSGEAIVWLNSDRGGSHAVEIRLASTCPDAGGTEVPSEQVGARRFERPSSVGPELSGDRFYLFDGGCVRYRYAFDADAPSALLLDVDETLELQPRAGLVAYVGRHDDQALCGAGASCAG